jgi:uncharacterized protein
LALTSTTFPMERLSVAITVGGASIERGYWAAMSQENVEIVRRLIERYNAGDFPWDLLDSEVVWVLDPPAWLAGTYRGHDGVGTLFNGMAEAFDEVRVEVDRYLDAGDVVVTLGRMEVRGGLSGVTTGQPLAQVIRVRDGLVVAIRGNLPFEEALEVAGLQDEASSPDTDRVAMEAELRWEDALRRRLE